MFLRHARATNRTLSRERATGRWSLAPFREFPGNRNTPDLAVQMAGGAGSSRQRHSRTGTPRENTEQL